VSIRPVSGLDFKFRNIRGKRNWNCKMHLFHRGKYCRIQKKILKKFSEPPKWSHGPPMRLQTAQNKN